MPILPTSASHARLRTAFAICASVVLLGGCGGDDDRLAVAGGGSPVQGVLEQLTTP